MIKNAKSYFLLSTEKTSLLLRVNEIRKVTTEYFGPRIQTLEEAPSLSRRDSFLQGTQVAYDEKNPALSLDMLKSDFATFGKGDFSSPSLDLSTEDQTIFDFVYDSFSVRKPVEIEDYPTPSGAEEELVIVCVEPVLKIRLLLHYFVYEKADVIGRYVEIVNDSEKPLSIRKAMSYQLVLANRSFELTTLYGSWANECQIQKTPIGKIRMVNESSQGLSGNRHNPFFLLKEKSATPETGLVYGFNLVYSGNHQESVEEDTWGNVRVQAGISPLLFLKRLSPGERFLTPMGVLAVSSEGLNGLSLSFQHFVNDCVIPPYWRNRPRPIAYNNWEATMFAFTKRKIFSLMRKASSLGIETFVLDDGWFGKRNDDTQGLGDWQVNENKIPGGLKSLSDYAKKRKMAFGIWMEPEMVNEKSELFEKHPDWIISDHRHLPSQGRHQFVLDLTRREVQDFVYQSVRDVLRSADITFLKWDCNRNLSDVPGGYGTFYLDYVKGLYSVLKRLRADFPKVLFENCASGGNRYDLGMLSFFPQSWMSDDTDSFQRVLIQSGAALGYPPSIFSNHVAAKTSNQLLRSTSFDSKFDVAAFGVLGYELNIDDLSPIDEKTIKKQIVYYKKHRSLLQFGDFRVLKRMGEEQEEWWQCQNGDEALAGRFEFLQKPNPSEGRLQVVSLKEDQLYHYETRQESISLKKFGSLINMVSPVHLSEDGVAITVLSHHKDMKGEIDEGVASGAALSHGGVILSQEWSGVGFGERLRLVGDFGGRLYYVSKANSSPENKTH